MAFLRNDAINRVNLHYGIQALAQGAGATFFLVFLLAAGVPAPTALLAQAAIVAGRFALRPLVLPFAVRYGVKPVLIFGALGVSVQYPILAEVDGIGPPLIVLVVVAAVGEVCYWLAYNAYFAAVGDTEHRGHQIGAREALVAVVGIVAPLLGAWALLTIGPRPAFALIGLVQAASVLPLLGAPNVPVRRHAPGAFRAARPGMILIASDGWFDAYFILVWQIALFVSLGESIAAYGGAMALAGLAGAIAGLLLGRRIDSGHGRQAVAIAYGVAAAIVLLRAASLDSPWLAVGANAIGGFFWPLLGPALGTAVYNLAKVSPCPFRFHMATEGGWDVGCFAACLLAAGLLAWGAPLSLTLLLAFPGIVTAILLLRRLYPKRA